MYDLFFAQLFGLYFIIVGLVVAVRQQTIRPIISQLAHNRSFFFLVAFLELAAGLALVLRYPEVNFTLPGVISLVGWMLTVESIFYLTMPHRSVERIIKAFNTPAWYMGGGALSVLIGAYLALIGFGMW